ncbi:T9SS type A sorting domain-containing protein [uncultured Algibacter sp.]|uniref:T9SS type A sorting domain-containing protein n=1 Tax=uncultured Algibacter sp. TaxID=298659 RepID=UPI0026298E3D|nr:T9SS type A sorting domain-containing protein [uncultured Algibacter sp.]
MIKKLPLKIAFLLVGFLISAPTLFAQVSLREISLKEQIDNSSLVIEGKVIFSKAFWDANHKMIYTRNTVEVYKVFKGEPVDTIEIMTEGGIVGLNAILASHSLKLGKGSFGIFTLYGSNINIDEKGNSKYQKYRTYSEIQGFYKYDLYGNTVSNTLSRKKGIATSFYSDIINITNKKYLEVKPFDVKKLQKQNTKNTNSRPPSGISLSPLTITAGGVGPNSILTITGSGFGAAQGKVGFRDADDGGTSFFDALDTHVESWTDTEITVRVPTINTSDETIAGTAGTGIIRVTDGGGSSAFSSETLTIRYAEQNLPTDFLGSLTSYQSQHYGDNNNLTDGFSGGYTWEMFEDFFNDSDDNDYSDPPELLGAKASFIRAFDSWRCETKVNWEVSTTPTSVDDRFTPENIIRFDNGSELGAGILGTCYSSYGGRDCSGEIIWYVTDLDIVFDDGVNWYFGESGETFDSGEFDFETVALHELGHGFQLGHVIDPSNVMHYALASNSTATTLDANSIEGASNVHSRSTSNQICGTPILPLMTDYTGTCGLSVDDNTLEEGIFLYPNPAKKEFFIKSSYLNIDRVEIYDVSGRLISDTDIFEGTRVKAINMNHASKGLYFVNIHSEERFITKKLILD